MIRAQRNPAYLLRMLFGKNLWERNFDFLPQKIFMGVQSQNFVKIGHFWRFFGSHSVAFPNGTLIFSEMNLLGRCQHFLLEALCFQCQAFSSQNTYDKISSSFLITILFFFYKRLLYHIFQCCIHL